MLQMNAGVSHICQLMVKGDHARPGVEYGVQADSFDMVQLCKGLKKLVWFRSLL